MSMPLYADIQLTGSIGNKRNERHAPQRCQQANSVDGRMQRGIAVCRCGGQCRAPPQMSPGCSIPQRPTEAL